MKARLLLPLSLVLLVTGCGGGSKPSTTPGALSGNWQMSLQKDNSTLPPKTQSGFLLQQSDVVTGNVMLKATPCSGVGSVNGMLSGANIALTVNPVGVTVNLSGSVGSDQTSMTGSYTIISQGCGGSQTAPETGTWTANLVKPVSGSFTGTYTSHKLGNLAITGQVSQSANNESSAPLAGNLGVTGYCFSSTTVSGTISGTQVVMNLLSSDGTTQLAEITGNASLDGKSISGTLFVPPQGPGGTPPCVDGDSGPVTLSF
jgi:hypothetical protein